MKKLTKEQAAVLGAFTGILCGPFFEMHEYIEKIMGRRVWTHELASKEISEKIKEKAKEDFMALVRE